MEIIKYLVYTGIFLYGVYDYIKTEKWLKNN